jgi:hypothetical protein
MKSLMMVAVLLSAQVGCASPIEVSPLPSPTEPSKRKAAQIKSINSARDLCASAVSSCSRVLPRRYIFVLQIPRKKKRGQSFGFHPMKLVGDSQ